MDEESLQKTLTCYNISADYLSSCRPSGITEPVGQRSLHNEILDNFLPTYQLKLEEQSVITL